MKKLLILCSLIFVVFLAGCAQQATTTGGTGVIIKSFAPDLTTVDAGSTVTFSLAVKNTGEKSATAVKGYFFGLSDDWDPITPTMLPVKSLVSSLAPADPTTGMTGEEAAFTWDATIHATKGKKTVDVTYDASVRVFYDYSTVSDTFLRFVTTDYAKTNPTVQKGIITSTSTAGPLLITASARTPILSSDSTTGRVQFDIQNIGAGRVFDGVADATGKITALDQIKEIKIEGVGTTGKCAGKAADANGIVTLTSADGTKLAAGKSKVVSCDVDAKGITNFADRAPKITITYSYFVDSAAQVTVSKALQ